MEAAAPPVTTGSKTMADLLRSGRGDPRRRTPARATRSATSGSDVTYAAGRRDRHGDRPRPDRPRHRSAATASASWPTRAPSGPTATSASPSAGAVVVPIYPTNSPEECEWVAGNSEAVAVIARGRRAGREDRRGPRQAAQPAPHHRDGRGADADAIALDDLRERGRGRDAAELEARMDAVRPERPVHVHLHVRHDRAAQGLRADARQLPLDARHVHVAAACCAAAPRRRHLPVPAAGALVRAADPAARRSTSAARSPTSAATRARSSPRSRRSSRPTCRRCRASSRSSTRSPRPSCRRRRSS